MEDSDKSIYKDAKVPENYAISDDTQCKEMLNRTRPLKKNGQLKRSFKYT